MNILVTGSEGFIAKNLIVQLKNLKCNIIKFNKNHNVKDLENKILKSDFIFHLAGENRSNNNKDFFKNNVNLSKKISEIIISKKLNKKIIFSSSTQVLKNKKSIYAKTKLMAEKELTKCTKKTNSVISIYRLPNIYGKWSKENYNSVFATFAYNISRSKNIRIFNSKNKLKLIYIDDLVDLFLQECKFNKKNKIKHIKNYILITPKKLAEILMYFQINRTWFGIKNVDTFVLKKMYSSFLTYAPPSKYVYKLKKKEDHRGYFTEFLKMGNSGQISYFTIKKGKIRGMHYHNTKIEKFLILKGKAKFKFKNLINDKTKTYILKENEHKVIETVPGWIHTIKNIGMETVFGIIWANEEFKINKSDTYYVQE